MRTAGKFSVGIIAALVIVSLVVVVGGWAGLVEKNNDQNWQIKQSLTGKMSVIDTAGYYAKMFGTVWTYPRTRQVAFIDPSRDVVDNSTSGADQERAIRVTFNDGGNAEVSTMLRYRTPTGEDQCRDFHRQFSGNIENVDNAVYAHLVNCLKQSAPLMSASEHQAARKSEFNRLVDEQMRHGLYVTRRTQVELPDQFDEKGDPIKVWATEIVVDGQGAPIVADSGSPLTELGIEIIQFSVLTTEYDQATQNQFATKKESFLRAEQAKAEREQEIQQRLMVQERGLRERAEAEATANVEKAKAVIAAQQKAEVAEQQKIEAVTRASQKVEVAAQNAAEAEQLRQIAEIELQTAELNGQAIERLAEAREQEILLGGALTERERELAQIWSQRDIGVAQYISQIAVPATVISGNSEMGGDGNGSMMENMMSMWMMQQMGINSNQPLQARAIQSIGPRSTPNTSTIIRDN